MADDFSEKASTIYSAWIQSVSESTRTAVTRSGGGPVVVRFVKGLLEAGKTVTAKKLESLMTPALRIRIGLSPT